MPRLAFLVWRRVAEHATLCDCLRHQRASRGAVRNTIEHAGTQKVAATARKAVGPVRRGYGTDFYHHVIYALAYFSHPIG